MQLYPYDVDVIFNMEVERLKSEEEKQMNPRKSTILGSLLISALLSARGPSPAEQTASAGVDKNYRQLRGLEDIGDPRSRINAVSKSFNLSIHCDMVAFRRGEVGVRIIVTYPDGDKPAMPKVDLARLMVERVQKFWVNNQW